MEPATSWFLVGFVNCCITMGTPSQNSSKVKYLYNQNQITYLHFSIYLMSNMMIIQNGFKYQQDRIPAFKKFIIQRGRKHTNNTVYISAEMYTKHYIMVAQIKQQLITSRKDQERHGEEVTFEWGHNSKNKVSKYVLFNRIYIHKFTSVVILLSSVSNSCLSPKTFPYSPYKSLNIFQLNELVFPVNSIR